MVKLIHILTSLILTTILVLLIGVGMWFYSMKNTIETTIRDTHQAIIEVTLTASNLRKASLAWENSSREQALETTKAMSNVNAAAVALSGFISRTDNSVNSILLPQLTNSIAAQSAALLESQKSLQANLASLLATTTQLQKTIADADNLITDPGIKVSIDNLSLATQNANAAVIQLDATLTDFHQVADKFRSDYLKPQVFAWSLIKTLIGLGGSTAQMVK